MSLIYQKLSTIQPGTAVRFTQRNGQIVDGVIINNDGTESLAVQVMSTAILKYEDITGLEEFVYSQAGQNVIPHNNNVADYVQPVPQKSEKIEIHKVTCDKDTIKQAFKVIDSDAKKALNVTYDKYNSFLSSHDNSKIKEAMDMTWNIIDEMVLDYNPEVNIYYAYLSLLNDDNYKSAVSFFYGNNLRNAYCTAYHGAVDNNNDLELYSLAAVFAAAYIVAGNTENLDEAAEVIKICTEKTNDLGALKVIVNNNYDKSALVYIWDILKYLGALKGVAFQDFSNLKKCVSEIQSYYPVMKIEDEFGTYKEDIISVSSEKEEVIIPKEEKSVSSEEVDTTKTFKGIMKLYKFTESTGTIVGENDEQYPFELVDVSDASLEKTLKKTVRKNINIPVSFRLMKRMKKYYAVNIEKIQTVAAPKSAKQVESDNPKVLFSKKKYEKAIVAYTKMLDTPEWEEAFSQIIMCYICLWNANGDLGYSSELEKFVEKYGDQISDNAKTAEALFQYNMKIQNYSQAINFLNTLLELCKSDEHGRMLHYIFQKERCYRNLKDYSSALSQLMDWLDIVKRNKLAEHYSLRENSIYIEIAEIYFELEDYKNAEKYCKLASDTERKRSLAEKLDELHNPEEETEYHEDIDEDSEDDEDEQEFVFEESEENLQTAYEAYIDDTAFDELGITDKDIAEKISIFAPEQLYSLLTYLKSAAKISSSSIAEYTNEDGSTGYISSSIQSLDSAFGYAFNSPLNTKEYISTEIISVFENTKRLIKDINKKMFAASAMTALFNNQSVPDYGLEDLVIVVEDYNFDEMYPTLAPLVNTLCQFKQRTGYGIDVFADYKTNSSVIDKIIDEANSYREAVDMRKESYESQGQVRRTREYIFSSEESELRKCLDIAASNDINGLSYVKNRIADLFIRNGKSLDSDNIDIKKVDAYIDNYWNLARDIIISEGRHISRPHDKIKSGKRNNIISSIKKIVSCICLWIDIAENSEHNDDAYAKERYEENAPYVVKYLSELIESCEKNTVENGFDWGNESLRYTASELLSKMQGTYDSRTRKYMFIDFLRSDEILLNEKYLPELQSTLNGWKDFSILSRIERHATQKHLSFEERISEILSDSETKHNFRSVVLIKNYGDDMQIESISEHKDFSQLGECLKQAKQRFENLYYDFNDEMEMYESYGRISDIDGEKTNMLNLAFQWYKITRITNDYGFYVKLLDVIRNRIAVNAIEKGERLKRQLEELADKPEYDFGTCSKENIAVMIEDQNYTVVEYLLNCIRRHDTKEVTDYTIEPFSFFEGFMNEHATNYRIGADSGVKLESAVLKYAGCKNLERAMRQITGNASKDVKGGCNIINNWLVRSPAGADRIEKLLELLGINNCSVTTDGSNSQDSYMVYCKKQTGKVNYPYPIPAFSSSSQDEGFRVLCLYGKFTCNTLMETFRNINSVAKNTIVFLDYAMNQDERRKLARKIKEEKSFARTFVVVDRVIITYLAKHYTKTDISKMLMAVAMPFAYYQPFVEASNQTMPPELFTGREAELTSIESPEGANLVYGGRQLGKSALLKMAQRNIDGNANNDRALLIEIKDLNYTEAAKIVSSELVIAGILDDGCQCDDWNVLAAHIKRRLLDENPETKINYLLLMLDEADEFISTSVADGNIPITALKNLPPKRFKLVMAGLHNLSRYDHQAMIGNNSTLIHLNSIIVRPFKRPEAIKLLTNTLAYLGFKFNNDVISLILAKTNYFPGLIQLYCQKLIEAMKDDYAGYSEINTPSYKVTESHFKKVLSDSQFMDKVTEKLEITLFTEETGHSFYHIIALVLSFLYYTLPSEKGYTIDDIIKVADEYNITRLKNAKREQIDELLHEMWDLNVLSLESSYYRFATDSFREMLGNQDEIVRVMTEYSEEGKSV